MRAHWGHAGSVRLCLGFTARASQKKSVCPRASILSSQSSLAIQLSNRSAILAPGQQLLGANKVRNGRDDMVACVRLESIAESELDNFLDTIRPPYAAEHSLADHISYVEAEQFVRRQFEDSLPLGFRTLGHHFLRIVDAATAVHVGIVWLRLDNASRAAYLNNVTVSPEHRRKGYASAALEATAARAHAEGCTVLALNVFAPNTAAQRLYRKFGLEVVSMHMNMLLSDAAAA